MVNVAEFLRGQGVLDIKKEIKRLLELRIAGSMKKISLIILLNYKYQIQYIPKQGN